MFPVVDGDRLVGCVTTREIRDVPRDEWDRQTVGSVARECSSDNTVAADADAMEALSRMTIAPRWSPSVRSWPCR